MNVGEIGRREAVTVKPDAGVFKVAETMFREKVGSIVAEGQKLVGIVTNRELVIELLAADSDANQFDGDVPPGDVTVSDLMTTDSLTVSPVDEVSAVIAQMTDTIARRLPIVENGRVVDILPFDDLLVHLAEEYRRLPANLEALTDGIHAESPSR